MREAGEAGPAVQQDASARLLLCALRSRLPLLWWALLALTFVDATVHPPAGGTTRDEKVIRLIEAVEHLKATCGIPVRASVAEQRCSDCKHGLESWDPLHLAEQQALLSLQR